MPFTIVRQDISRMRVDAVVNAANEQLLAGGGVCGAIFAAAGRKELSRACAAIGHCDTGRAVITPGFSLPARYVIHAVGPVWRGGAQGEEALLRSAYTQSLALADQNGLESIAFPLISSGIYGYPVAQALEVAIGAIRAFLEDHELDVYLAVFGDEAFRLSTERYGDIQSYIDACDVLREATEMSMRIGAASETKSTRSHSLWGNRPCREASESDAPLFAAPSSTFDDLADTAEFDACPASASLSGLERRVGRLERTFSEAVLDLIDQKGFTDVQVYKRANLDRKLFSKLRGDPWYKPSKRTAVALCVALELELSEARALLERAGYALSPSERADVIVRYFLERRRYDIYEINEALFHYGQSCLGV